MTAQMAPMRNSAVRCDLLTPQMEALMALCSIHLLFFFCLQQTYAPWTMVTVAITARWPLVRE